MIDQRDRAVADQAIVHEIDQQHVRHEIEDPGAEDRPEQAAASADDDREEEEDRELDVKRIGTEEADDTRVEDAGDPGAEGRDHERDEAQAGPG